MGRSNGAVPVILVIYLIAGTAGISYFATDYNFSANRDYQFSEPMKITNESGGLAPDSYVLAYKNYVFFGFGYLLAEGYHLHPSIEEYLQVVNFLL